MPRRMRGKERWPSRAMRRTWEDRHRQMLEGAGRVIVGDREAALYGLAGDALPALRMWRRGNRTLGIECTVPGWDQEAYHLRNPRLGTSNATYAQLTRGFPEWEGEVLVRVASQLIRERWRALRLDTEPDDEESLEKAHLFLAKLQPVDVSWHRAVRTMNAEFMRAVLREVLEREVFQEALHGARNARVTRAVYNQAALKLGQASC